MEHSKGESFYEFLGIETRPLYHVVLQFYQYELIQKVLEATGMEICNVEERLGTDYNGTKAKVYCPH